MKYLILVCVFLMVGCAQFEAARLPEAKVSELSELSVVDGRVEAQRRTEMLSYMITNSEYGIQRLGDEWTIPNRIDYLSRELAVRAPEAKNVNVTDFVLYLNMQHSLREGNIYRGPIWELFEDSTKMPTTRYSKEENPDHEPVVIATINIQIDNISISERMLKEPECPKNIPDCNALQARAEAAKILIIGITEKVIDKYKSLTSKGSE